MHHSLTRLRELLYEQPGHQRWLEICRAMDDVPDEDVALGVEYVDAYAADWPPAVRWMRPAWVDQVLRNKRQPRLAIGRHLDLVCRDLDDTQVAALSQAPELGFVRELSLGGTFWGRGDDVAAASTLTGVKHLVVNLSLDHGTVADDPGVLRGGAWSNSVVSLTVQAPPGFAVEVFDRPMPNLARLALRHAIPEGDVLARAQLPSLDTLIIRHDGRQRWDLAALTDAAWLAQLRHLDLHRCVIDGLVEALVAERSVPLRHLSLMDCELSTRDVSALAESHQLGQLELVDLRGTGTQRDALTHNRSLPAGVVRY